MRLPAVENPHVEVIKHADRRCLEEVGLREVTHDPGNMSKHLEFSMDIARQEFGIGCLGIVIAERSI